MPVMVQKPFSILLSDVDSLQRCTSHASLRCWDFILFALVSTIRLGMVQSVSTLRKSVAFPRYRFTKLVQNVVSLSAIVVYGVIS